MDVHKQHFAAGVRGGPNVNLTDANAAQKGGRATHGRAQAFDLSGESGGYSAVSAFDRVSR